jgi:hypothetical protein
VEGLPTTRELTTIKTFLSGDRGGPVGYKAPGIRFEASECNRLLYINYATLGGESAAFNEPLSWSVSRSSPVSSARRSRFDKTSQ